MMVQAANVDATLTRLTKQQALQEEKKRQAADAAAAAERAVQEGQPLDPDFSPNGIGSAQFGSSEAEDRAASAAQLANEISQVQIYHYDDCSFHVAGFSRLKRNRRYGNVRHWVLPRWGVSERGEGGL